jgi:hypothetical protein
MGHAMLTKVAQGILLLACGALTRIGSAQESRIGLYHQTLFVTRDSGSTSESGNYIGASIYAGEKVGGWGFAYREPWYGAASIGPFWDVTDWLEVGVAFGVESLANDLGVYSEFGRVASMMWLGNEKVSLNLYYEGGASRRDWYQVDAEWRPATWLGLGILSQTRSGTGPRVTVRIPHTPIEAWVAPALFDASAHGASTAIGVQLIHRWTRE